MNRLNHMGIRAARRNMFCQLIAPNIVDGYSDFADGVKVSMLRERDESFEEYLMVRRIIECIRKPYRRVEE